MRKVTLWFVIFAYPVLAFPQTRPADAPTPRSGVLSPDPPASQLIEHGLAAEKGDGRSQSYTDARRLYEQASALGSAEASLHLGRLHLEGWGVPRDPARAAACIETAANAGLLSAQLLLCDMYLLGIGVTRDPATARLWAEKAAAQDDPAAEVRLGTLVEQGRLGFRPDIRLARDWYQLSSEQDYTRAMNAMAQSFLKPGATDLDREFAARWLELAVEDGNPTAAYVLAVLYVTRAPDDPGSLARAKELLQQSKNSRRGLVSYDAGTVLRRHADGASLLDAFRYVLGTSRNQRMEDDRKKRLATWETTDFVPPRYVAPPRLVVPESVKLRQLKGRVTLQFRITKAGFVEDIEVVSSDHPALADAAIAAIEKTRYLPAMKNGERIEFKMRLSFNLGLGSEPEFNTDALPAALPDEMTRRPTFSPTP